MKNEMPGLALDAESTPLVSSAQEGNRWAVERLIRDHAPWVRSAIFAVTGRSDVVDDIAQQVWLRVWQHLGTLKDPRQLRPWLYRIARRAALDHCLSERRRADKRGIFDEDLPVAAQPAAEPPAALLKDESRASLLNAVRSLPAMYREPLVMRHLEEWSYPRIAETLGLSIEAVETRLVRARRLLRETLQGTVEP